MDQRVVTNVADADLSDPGSRNRLGGKGHNLAVMRQQLDLPVPPAFVLGTDLCRAYLESGWPQHIEDDIAAELARLGSDTGREFGSTTAPMLVSVRSGAPVSMPGMMDTVLNVGINAAIAAGLATETGDEAFALDCHLRFCRMYADTVLGLPAAEIAQAEALATDMPGRIAAVQALAEEVGGIPDDPIEQLRYCIEAVFGSWHSHRAHTFREREGISEDLGTAAVVQTMVFGNLDDNSGTGVYFTRNPSTGENVPYGDYLPKAQGEDVVSGAHQVDGLDALAARHPDQYRELVEAGRRLERHETDMCDIEFTLSSGRLYLLQTRVGRRAPAAAVRIAVEMAADDDFPLSRPDAVRRVPREVIDQLTGAASVEAGAEVVASGLAASPGAASGVLCTDPDAVDQVVDGGTGVILARPETSPSDVAAMLASNGIITSLGGLVSHAAVVARGWGLPAVTGIEEMVVGDGHITVGGTRIDDGEMLTIDGSAGTVHRGNRITTDSAPPHEVETLRLWAAENGIDFGDADIPAPAPTGNGAVDQAALATIASFPVLRSVGLKGLAKPASLAEALGCTPAAIEAALDAEPDLWTAVGDRGVALSPAGRTLVAESLSEEREGLNGALEPIYLDFEPMNREFKALVTKWQTDDDLQATTDALIELDSRFGPLVERSGALLDRLARYRWRFTNALRAVQDGDPKMVASPLADSYHTVWFEYHEDLIALTGRDRAAEEAREAEHEARK